MTEDDDRSKPETEPGPEPEAPPEKGRETDQAAAGTDGQGELEISDELKQALQEAEAHLQKPPSGTDDGGAPEAGADAAEADQEEFDPNRPPEPVEAPPPPSPREMELKMQILDLRQKCREAEAEIEKKVKEIKINRDQAQHIQKQFDSYKSRVMKEKADWFNYGHEPIVKEILPVLDNLERALAHAGEAADPSAISEGVALILRQFQAVLEKFAVKPLDPSGECFNPEFHQAMMQVEDNKVPPNTVVQVSQKGYMMKDRLIRPAMVVVSKSSERAASRQDAAEDGGSCPAPEAAPGPATDDQDKEGA